MYSNFKRTLDIIFSFILIALFLPLFLIIIVTIKVESSGTFLFKQKRYAQNKKFFNIYKFRTMYSNAPKNTPTHMLENPEKYITKTGKFLRKYSLDELPQLFNIFFGDMSFIGPRPALWNQKDLIFLRDKSKANKVRPGLTGLAQVNGRDELSLEDKTRYDAKYSNKITFLGDFKIIILTIFKVILKKDIKEGDSNK